ncbi:MAG: transglycosylase SLT domain-containing protein [Nitrospirae bacterium]|nr:transglycosylase SLT domain-containing protein [Nitrospirota bacterium]MEC4672470.1 transglycosylase SLT domain-containing protein [Nitrospirota bacterium]
MHSAKEMLRNIVGCLVLITPVVVLWTSSQPENPGSKETNSISPTWQGKTSLPWLDTKRFLIHVQTRLPQYRALFEKAEEQYKVRWTLLAALAYQESRWDRYAKSPTGVRGLMMLTRNTAASLGIENRLDPYQSIDGGARYLAYLVKQIPRHIQEPDRTGIALAAYNVGWGHIKDAQNLARRFNKNPDSWEDLKTVLPLLSQPEYYQTLEYGYARGNEPVRTVERTKAYRDLLEQYLREV